MEVGHILLERPWQFDKHVIHDGLTNKIIFHRKGKKITPYPLLPRLIKSDQELWRIQIQGVWWKAGVVVVCGWD